MLDERCVCILTGCDWPPLFFFSSRRRHTRWTGDWSSDVCSSDLIDTQRLPGQDTLYRGSTWVAINRWAFTDAGNQNYRLKIVTTYKTIKNRVRSDSTETTIPCNVFS